MAPRVTSTEASGPAGGQIDRYYLAALGRSSHCTHVCECLRACRAVEQRPPQSPLDLCSAAECQHCACTLSWRTAQTHSTSMIAVVQQTGHRRAVHVLRCSAGAGGSGRWLATRASCLMCCLASQCGRVKSTASQRYGPARRSTAAAHTAAAPARQPPSASAGRRRCVSIFLDKYKSPHR
jgi:hypothetical protein